MQIQRRAASSQRILVCDVDGVGYQLGLRVTAVDDAARATPMGPPAACYGVVSSSSTWPRAVHFALTSRRLMPPPMWSSGAAGFASRAVAAARSDGGGFDLFRWVPRSMGWRRDPLYAGEGFWTFHPLLYNYLFATVEGIGKR
jgi:hypothetical protein